MTNKIPDGQEFSKMRHIVFGQIAQAILVNRLAMSVHLSTFWLKYLDKQNLGNEKGYKLET